MTQVNGAPSRWQHRALCPIEAVKRRDSKSLTTWRWGKATASAIFNQMPTILGQDGPPTMATKHPEICVTVEASGDDYRLVDHVIKAMRRAGLATEEIEEFFDEAMSGEDRELVRICSRWVTLVP